KETMKKSPQEQKLERMLRSSKFSAGGFLGTDKRNLWEIIDTDATAITRAGKTMEEVAMRMQEITEKGKTGLGDWVEVDRGLHVTVNDSRGMIPCPWPHHVRCSKRITTVKHSPTGTVLRWSDLNIHLIKAHGFFEGRGASFRIEPELLLRVLFNPA
ncbi:MAG: hypothetical protein PVH23_04705, partial [candidate division WOR-3 bacterium]